MKQCPIGPARVREDKDIQTCDITGRPLDADGVCLYHFINSTERENAK